MHCSALEVERAHHERDAPRELALELDRVLALEREDRDLGARARLEGALGQAAARVDRVRVVEDAAQRAGIGPPAIRVR